MKLATLALLFFALILNNCASSSRSNIEAAKFDLDNERYDAAIEEATNALASDSQNIEASRILASAYFGRGGFDFLTIAETVLDLDSDTATNFAAMAGAFPTTATMADVRSAITTVEGLDDVDAATLPNDGYKSAVFDLGFMEAIEIFALGVFESGYKTGTFDVTGITDADRAIVQADLVNFDNRLIASGVASDESFLSQVRQVFCILEPLSGTDGFTVAEYRALVGCQLQPTTFDPSAVTAGAVATCAALDPSNQSAAVQACYNEDTSL